MHLGGGTHFQCQTQEAEEEDLGAPGQPGLQSESLKTDLWISRQEESMADTKASLKWLRSYSECVLFDIHVLEDGEERWEWYSDAVNAKTWWILVKSMEGGYTIHEP